MEENKIIELQDRKLQRFTLTVVTACSLFHIVLFCSVCIILMNAKPNSIDSAETEIVGWEKSVSRSVTKYLNPFNDTTIISGRKICNNSRTKLVIIVPISPDRFQKRTLIRETWASYNMSQFKVGFLVGLTKSESIQTALMQESERFHDVIQENLVDTYYNLTLKSIAMLKWYINRCQNSSLLMKADDDTFVDVELLLSQMAGYHDRVLMGSLCNGSLPNRDITSKWYVPQYMFEEKVYPKYLRGAAYLISKDVAIRLYAASLETPIFHLEDVYITGICARNAQVEPASFPGSYFISLQIKKEDCLTRNHTICHSVSPDVMLQLWENRAENT